MTISTITIATVNYTSYASVAEADARLAVDPTRSVAWAALSVDQKGANLVAATNRLDLLPWLGSKTGGDDVQEHAWPRTGLTFRDGSAVSTTEVPKEVENATILVAGSIALDATQGNVGTSGTNVKSVKAGSAAVEFFRQQAGVILQDESAFKLIQFFLQGTSPAASIGNMVSGNDACSTFSDIDQWGLTRGFP